MKIPHVLLRLVYQSTEKEKNSFSKSTSRRTLAGQMLVETKEMA